MAGASRAQLEKVAQALAVGKSPEEASRIAGYRDTGARTADGRTVFSRNADRRSKNPWVKVRVAELQAPGIAKLQEIIVINLEWATQKYLAVIENTNLSDPSIGDYLRALEGMLKVHGLFAPDRFEHSGPQGQPIEMIATDEQRVRALQVFLARAKAKTAA